MGHTVTSLLLRPNVQDLILTAPINVDALPRHVASAIEAFQRDNPQAYQSTVLTVREAIEMWLQWNGIIGYTEQIIETVLTCWTLGATTFEAEKGAMRHG